MQYKQKKSLRQNRFLAAPLRQRFSPKALLHVKKNKNKETEYVDGLKRC